MLTPGRREQSTGRGGPSFLGNPQNLGIDARTMSDEDAGIEVGSIEPADQGGNPVF